MTKLLERRWMQAIPGEDLRTYRSAGFLNTLQLGKRPVLIVVDVTYSFTGSPGLTLEEAIDEYPTACGPAAWEAMPRIAELIGLFRTHDHPIIFTNSDPTATPFTGRATKSRRIPTALPRAEDFPPEIAPRQGEWVLSKTKASCFFGTPLPVYLVREGVDTVVVCGVSTSGCVRASVVDSCSYGFTTLVVEDCCFDRSWFAHCANLYDMDAKYASAVPLSAVAQMVGSGQAPAIRDVA